MEKMNNYEIPMNKEPLELLCKWVKERYTVHIKKDVKKLPAPWSDWKIMQEYRFTNVLRRHDKESKKVISSTYENKDLTIEEKILNAFVFRAYNKHETYSLVGFPRKKNYVSWEELLSIEERIKEKRKSEPNYCFCTSAFNTGGIKTCWGNFEDPEAAFDKTNLVESRFVLLWNDLIKKDVANKVLRCSTAEDVGKTIRKVRGFAGEFLSFQVYVDLTYIPEFPFKEDDWAICGPGCKLGLSYLFGDENKSIEYLGLTYDDLLYWFRDNATSILKDNGVDLSDLMIDLPMKERRLSLSNVENLFCEVGKTYKLFYKEGKARRKYQVQMDASTLY